MEGKILARPLRVVGLVRDPLCFTSRNGVGGGAQPSLLPFCTVAIEKSWVRGSRHRRCLGPGFSEAFGVWVSTPYRPADVRARGGSRRQSLLPGGLYRAAPASVAPTFQSARSRRIFHLSLQWGDESLHPWICNRLGLLSR